MSIKEVVSRIPIFIDLDEAELQKIADISMLRTYHNKSHVFMEGEERHSVYFINKGMVKIYKIDGQGNEYILAFLKKGEMFPHSGFFEQTPYPGTAEIVAESELCVIPIKEFEKIMLSHPQISIKIMRVMGQKIRELQAKLQELSSKDVHYRLYALVLRLADEYGEETPEGIHVKIKLSNSDMALMAGTTRETVNRFLNKLKKEGVLSPDTKSMIIMDKDALEQWMRQ